MSVVQSEEHRNIALEAALETVVLLKNTKEKGLPITKPVKSACVSGLE